MGFDAELILMNLLLPEPEFSVEKNKMQMVFINDYEIKTKFKNYVLGRIFKNSLINNMKEFKQYTGAKMIGDLYDHVEFHPCYELMTIHVPDANWDIQLGEYGCPNIFFTCKNEDIKKKIETMKFTYLETEYTTINYDGGIWIHLYTQPLKERKNQYITYEIYADIIPILKDNYIQILRLLKNKIYVTNYAHQSEHEDENELCTIFYVLIIREFLSDSITFDQLKTMFKEHDILVVKLDEIEIITDIF